MNKRPRVVLVGAFPPPLHGMAAVNAAACERLRAVGSEPLVIDIAASSLDRSLLGRIDRLPRVISGLCRLALVRGFRGMVLYMSVSGGLGQLYELIFLLLGRIRGYRSLLASSQFRLSRAPELTD